MKTITKTNLAYLLLFGAAMGLMEAIIVIYLREIYYPSGFNFPLVEITPRIFVAELVRELCTIVMLFSISAIAGKTRLHKFSFFLFSFAVWDIFYYVGLKAFINWPSSLFTWDILFLLPVTWLGPLLAPLICSVSMIFLSVVLLHFQERMDGFRLTRIEWLSVILGAVLIFVAFIWDFSNILFSNQLYTQIFNLAGSERYREIVSSYIPEHFNWSVFDAGIVLIYVTIFLISYRTLKRNKQNSHKG
jgi:hypothetical protein